MDAQPAVEAARLGPSFFARPAERVARELLGATLWVRGRGVQRARVVETEAYVGPHDLACHASKGLTPRTRVIFGPPGRAYVYLVYGMHHMLNAVTGQDGDGEAVLIRAAEPLAGIGGPLHGPGRLTRTLGITVQGDNAADLATGRIGFFPGTPPEAVARTPRIGVDYAGDWADAPLRFVDAKSAHLSVPLR